MKISLQQIDFFMITKEFLIEQQYLLWIQKLKYFKGESSFEEVLELAKVILKLTKEREKEVFGRATLKLYASELKDFV
ncbi:hypothetical protein IT568_02010 [bacterium]|nr:hypothetical protein [bacterium]